MASAVHERSLELAAKALATLEAHLDSEDGRIACIAATAILDRAYGKPATAKEVPKLDYAKMSRGERIKRLRAAVEQEEQAERAEAPRLVEFDAKKVG